MSFTRGKSPSKKSSGCSSQTRKRAPLSFDDENETKTLRVRVFSTKARTQRRLKSKSILVTRAVSSSSSSSSFREEEDDYLEDEDEEDEYYSFDDDEDFERAQERER